MRLKLNILYALLLLNSAYVFAIEPKYSIKTSGNVSDMIFEDSKLYVSTDNGKICIYNIPAGKLLNTYTFPTIKDFIGDDILPKVYDIDKIAGKDILISISQGIHGFSNVYLTKNGQSIKVLGDSESRLIIRRVRFINEDEVIFGLLSNEIILYDITNGKELYRKQISPYTFSDFVLNENRTRIITADESGIIHVIDTKTGETMKELSGNNVDNVYQIDQKKDIIVCGGQDRRLSVYNLATNNSYYISSSFLIYSVGLSPSGVKAAFSCNENNDIEIINTKTKSKQSVLSAHKSTITKILFIAEDKLFTSAEEDVIYYWEL